MLLAGTSKKKTFLEYVCRVCTYKTIHNVVTGYCDDPLN